MEMGTVATLPRSRWLGGVNDLFFSTCTWSEIGTVSLQPGQMNSRSETSSTILHLIFAPMIG
jgi:hypothetical protein